MPCQALSCLHSAIGICRYAYAHAAVWKPNNFPGMAPAIPKLGDSCSCVLKLIELWVGEIKGENVL